MCGFTQIDNILVLLAWEAGPNLYIAVWCAHVVWLWLSKTRLHARCMVMALIDAPARTRTIKHTRLRSFLGLSKQLTTQEAKYKKLQRTAKAKIKALRPSSTEAGDQDASGDGPATVSLHCITEKRGNNVRHWLPFYDHCQYTPCQSAAACFGIAIGCLQAG